MSDQFSWKWLLTAAAAVGIGFWAIKTFGPDARRYLKIESM